MEQVDQVAFRVREGRVEIDVGGRPLGSLIDGGPYHPLPVWAFHDDPAHFLGGPESHRFCGNDQKTLLLGCECGEPGCDPLMARVDAGDDAVTWSGFERPHQNGSDHYADVGPFRFARSQYDAALASLAAELRPE